MRPSLVALLLVLPSFLFGEEPPASVRHDALLLDLKMLARVTELAENLNDTRQVMRAVVDDEIETLREPRGDGSYRWASLQREEGGRVDEEKQVEKVYTEPLVQSITVTAPRAYRLLVTAPQKRNLVSANNRIYLRKAIVEMTAFDDKTTRSEIPIDVWVAPGDSHGVALPDIARSARVSVEVGVESGNKKAVANVALLQAKLVDDPQSPFFPAVQRLHRIRQALSEKEIRRGDLKTAIDEALLTLPGELEKRAAEQAAAAEQRLALSETGMKKGSIAPGDATPDIVHALAEILRLLGGNLDDQAEARTQLQSLVDSLKP